MNRKWFSFSLSVLFVSSMFLGFKYLNNSFNDNNPFGSRNKNSTINNQSDYPNNNNLSTESTGSVYYHDNFDSHNDTTSLKNRGYKIFYRSSGAQGLAPIWFQGNSAVFASFNGPSTGYVAANFQVLSSANNIDNWLILPDNNTSAGDSIIFYSRSDSGSVFPDSVRVMFSSAGDSVPEGSWTELGKYKAGTNGVWQRLAFGAASSGVNSRFAIRYKVVNGGPGGVNSDYIGIDELTLERIPGANDMSAAAVINPAANITLPVSLIAPKATFKNIGSSSQTNIPVTFKITGPVNYTSNKTITSLSSGATVQINFDSTFNPLAGSYTVTIYSGLASDGNRYNDTVKSTFSVSNLSYGSSAGYFYSNSTTDAIPAPSQPQYCRKDTSGSTSLVVNNVNVMQGITTGDLDDGYWKILLPAGKKVRFFGSNYDTIRIGTNGIIPFQGYNPSSGNWIPPSAGIPGGSVTNAVYPLWNDFDFSDNTISATNRISYKVAGNLLLISYDRAPVYSGDPGDYVSFQITMEISSSPVSNSNIIFQYSDTASGRTGSSFISDVNNNTLGSHLIGIQNSAGTSALTYRFRNSSSIISAGRIFNSPSGSLALQLGPNSSQLNGGCQSANITSRLELLQLTRKDTISVSLRESVSPFEIVETGKSVYDTLSGTASFPFTLASNGSSYYIYLTHRNSISTWSSAPVVCTGNLINFNFTTGISQAYGSNQILVGGLASVFTGDVSRDGCVDLTDLVAIYNKAAVFTIGNYVIEDLNYDEIVDLTDLISCYNSVADFVCESAPPGALRTFDNTKIALERNTIINYQKDTYEKSLISKKDWIKKMR